jgi:hypothetical protein
MRIKFIWGITGESNAIEPGRKIRQTYRDTKVSFHDTFVACLFPTVELYALHTVNAVSGVLLSEQPGIE